MFENLKNYFTEKRLGKLRRDLALIHKTDYTFNPFEVGIPETLLIKRNQVKHLIEDLAWYSAEPEALEQYYQSCPFKSRNEFFWKKKPSYVRAIHSGLPALISEKMSIILFGPGIDFKVSVLSQSGKIDALASEEVQKVFDDMVRDSQVMAALKKAAQAESWSGHVALKLCLSQYSKFPIIEVYDRRFFDVVKEHGITTAITFHSFYEKKFSSGLNKRRYRLDETYTTNDAGEAIVLNRLFEIKNNEEIEIELTTLPETATLEPLFVFEGIKGMAAFDKPNKGSQNILLDNPYGQSDYAKSYSVFDGLDEVVSVIIEEARTNKTQRYIPESRIPVDSSGNFKKVNEFVNNYVKVVGDVDQNSEDKIDIQQIMDKTDQHFQKYKIYVSAACNLSGLSPLSLGITGLESINSSDKSTRERAKTTLETRKDKIDLWSPLLERLMEKMIELYKFESKQLTDVNFDNLDISIVFKDYIETGISERVTTWSAAKMSGVCSIDMAVDKIHGNELSPERKKEEADRIRLEQGLLADSGENLLKLDLSEEPDEETG